MSSLVRSLISAQRQDVIWEDTVKKFAFGEFDASEENVREVLLIISSFVFTRKVERKVIDFWLFLVSKARKLFERELDIELAMALVRTCSTVVQIAKWIPELEDKAIDAILGSGAESVGEFVEFVRAPIVDRSGELFFEELRRVNYQPKLPSAESFVRFGLLLTTFRLGIELKRVADLNKEYFAGQIGGELLVVRWVYYLCFVQFVKCPVNGGADSFFKKLLAAPHEISGPPETQDELFYWMISGNILKLENDAGLAPPVKEMMRCCRWPGRNSYLEHFSVINLLDTMSDCEACYRALSQLNISLENGDAEHVCWYWVERVTVWTWEFVNFESFDAEIFGMLLQLGQKAVQISRATNLDFVVQIPVSGESVEPVDAPKSFPLSEDYHSDWKGAKAINDFYQEHKESFSSPTYMETFARAFQFAYGDMGESDTFSCLTQDGHDLEFTRNTVTDGKIPEVDIAKAMMFCTLRYIHEQMTRKRQPRVCGKDDFSGDVTINRFVASLVYFDTPLTQVPNGYDVLLHYLVTINRNLYPGRGAQGIHVPRLWNNGECSYGNDINQLRNLDSKSFFAENPKREIIHYHSALGVTSASVSLLDQPSCLPLLSDRYLHHRLLKIFLGPKGVSSWDKCDFECDIETTAQFYWTYSIPDDKEFCSKLLSILHRKLVHIVLDMMGPDRYHLAFTSNSMTKAVSMMKSRIFFIENLDRIDCIQTMIAIVLRQIAKLEAWSQIDSFVLSDLSRCSLLHFAIPDHVKASLPSRTVLWSYLGSYLSRSMLAVHDGDFYSLVKFCSEMNIELDELSDAACDKIDKCQLEELLPFVNVRNIKAIMNAVRSLLTKDDIIHEIWASVLRQTGTCIPLFKLLPWNRDLVHSLIDATPPDVFTQQCGSEELARICVTLQKHLPHFRTEQLEQSQEPDSQMDWPEERKQQIPDEPCSQGVNLWEEKPMDKICEKHGENDSRIGFFCYDCDRRVHPRLICPYCAVNCHKGHRIAFGAYDARYTCCCSEICGCPRNGQEPDSVSVQKLVGLFLAFSKCPLGKRLDISSGYLPSRLLEYNAQTIKLGMPVESGTEGRVEFEKTSRILVNLEEIEQSYGTDGNVTKACQTRIDAALTRFCTTGGNLLFVANGNSIITYHRRSFARKSTFRIGVRPFLLSCQQLDHDKVLLAVAGLSDIEVYTVDKYGSAELLSTREASEPEAFIVSMEWIGKQHLAVLFRRSLEIYNLSKPQQRMVPFELFSLTIQDTSCTSVIYVEHAGHLTAVIALHNGRLVAQPVLTSSTGIVAPMSNFLPWKSRFVSIAIGQYKECNLMFLSAPGVNLHIYRLSEIWNENVQEIAHVGFENSGGETRFLGVYPGCETMLLFVHPHTNTLYTMEITDSSIDVSKIRIMSPIFHFFGRSRVSYGYFESNNKFYAIFGDGQLAKLTPCSPAQEYAEYRVPPTFWMQAEIATRHTSHITGTDPSQNYNTLYSNGVAYFRRGTMQRTLTYHPNEPQDCIVGVMLSFGNHRRCNRPDWVSVNGRKYDTSREENYMFPLMPRDIRPGQKMDLQFPNGSVDRISEITMQSTVVFTMPYDKIRGIISSARPQFAWKQNPLSLLDFCDEDLSETDEIRNAVWQFAKTVKVNPGDVIPDNYYTDLARVVYTNPNFSLSARNILVRLCRANQDGLRIWIETLQNVLKEGAVDPALWPYVWQDLLLCNDLSSLSEDIWSSEPEIGCPGSVVAAFSTQMV